MKEWSWYREFLTLGYPLPVLNFSRFMESLMTLWSVSRGVGLSGSGWMGLVG